MKCRNLVRRWGTPTKILEREGERERESESERASERERGRERERDDGVDVTAVIDERCGVCVCVREKEIVGGREGGREE